MWEIPTSQLKQTGLVGLFPLLILTREGRRLEVLEEAITDIQINGGEDTAELLSLIYLFASLAFGKKTRQLIQRRFGMLRDILKGTWAYEEILQEGKEEGREKGIKEERQKNQQELREAVVEVIQARFPAMLTSVEKTLQSIDDPAVLRRLLVNISIAQSEDKARQALLEVNQKH
ncbi:MAG: hypothetical protein M3Z24_08510 [Chloroflexota bacterium]|nr:hypothetical protein [Chloroflexota bacterium]